MCTHTFDRLSLQTNVQALLFDIQSGEMAGNSKHALFSSDYFLTNRHFSYDFPIFDLKVTKKYLLVLLPLFCKAEMSCVSILRCISKMTTNRHSQKTICLLLAKVHYFWPSKLTFLRVWWPLLLLRGGNWPDHIINSKDLFWFFHLLPFWSSTQHLLAFSSEKRTHDYFFILFWLMMIAKSSQKMCNSLLPKLFLHLNCGQARTRVFIRNQAF